MKRAIFAVLAIVFLAGGAEAKYSGGTGEANNPYRISDYNDLYALADDANDYNKCFVMTADIDLDPCLPGRRTLTTALIAPDIDDDFPFDGTALHWDVRRKRLQDSQPHDRDKWHRQLFSWLVRGNGQYRFDREPGRSGCND